jgi:hypothetical protein
MMNTQIQGAMTEQKCFLKCIELGYVVSKPLFDNARYDFILDAEGKLLRIQVKPLVGAMMKNPRLFLTDIVSIALAMGISV